MKIQSLRGRLLFLIVVLASMAYLQWIYEMHGLQLAAENAVTAALSIGTLFKVLSDNNDTAQTRRTEQTPFDDAPSSHSHFEGEQVISYYVEDSCGLHPVMVEFD